MVTYVTKGTCSTKIHLDVEDGILKSVKFDNGCGGNLVGISKLVEGMEVKEVIKRLKGIPCGTRKTSCPDQLARA
ncbi:MAG: TIGR03905 family TSCPD domain-containing protein, partial [Clostridiales bacterium]|nr:TIGR03905 family TSCPD domain-containing protein [Clostridiales bacterium]